MARRFAMMESKESFSSLDRATLRAWQSSNLVLWSLAGMAAAVVVHVVMANIDTIIEHAVFNDYPSLNYIHPWLAFADLVIGGAVMGAVIGRHVFRSAPAYAGIAAVVVSVFTLRLRVGYHDLPLVAAFAVQIAAAIIFAARAERRRPLALRGGRVTQ
jgi:hypothetical protein